MNRVISQIRVRGLFGRYDYELKLPMVAHEIAPKISLLYGSNGTGKTTILSLLYHVLSTSMDQANNSYVANTPFRQFEIIFTDGTNIKVTKPHNELIGGFTLSMNTSEGRHCTADVGFDRDVKAVLIDNLPGDFWVILNEIVKLKIPVHFMRDNRSLRSDSIEQFESPSDQRDNLLGMRRRHGLPGRSQDIGQLEATLIESINQTNTWLKDEHIGANTSGETQALEVYLEIIRSVVLADNSDNIEPLKNANELVNELLDIANISKDYQRFGLQTEFDVRELISNVNRAKPGAMRTLNQVLRPILDSQRARYEAINNIYEKTSTFVEIVNRFFIDKKVDLHVVDGLTVSVADERLAPIDLSSGEKHLLLMFVNALIMHDRWPLVLIDEPELSLNIDWQRKIIDGLLELSKGTNTQYVIATHSVSILAGHSELEVEVRHVG